VEITTLLREITCQWSHSVTCHPAAVTFPPLLQPKLVRDLPTPGYARLSWPRRCLQLKIVYLRKTFTYLKNNQAMSWPRLGFSRRKSQIPCPNHYTTKPLKIGWRGFHITVAQSSSFSVVSLKPKFEGILLIGTQTRVGGFWLRDVISRKQCEIEVTIFNH